MRPVVDSKGQLWFGAMGHNALSMFNPYTQKFSQFLPPGGMHGIMGLAVAHDDTIWFAEQYANYIGHFNPQDQLFTIYTLPEVNTPNPNTPDKMLSLPSAPNDLALDAKGNVWFTEMNTDMIGMLDVKTGEFKHYQIGAQKTVQTLSPYGITIDAQDIVWFTQASNNELGRLDPVTGLISFFPTRNANDPLMQITTDADGKLWITTFRSPNLLCFDPLEEAFTSYFASTTNQASGGLYDLAIAKDGSIWATVTGANQIARLDTLKKRFTYYDVPTPASVPLGIDITSDGTIWFTEANGNKIGTLKA